MVTLMVSGLGGSSWADSNEKLSSKISKGDILEMFTACSMVDRVR